MRWFRRLVHKSRTEKQLDKELRFHLEQQIAGYVKAGMPPDKARRRAQLEFGGIDRVKEEVRDTRWETRFENILRDFRYAFRSLRKDRRFALIAILALALGIGATTAIFSVINATLLRPLPYRDPSRLVWVDEIVPHFDDTMVLNPEYTNWSTNNHTFEAMAAYGAGETNLVGVGEPERIEMAAVTANFLAILGIQPVRGRAFLPDEDRPDGPLAVIFADSFWRRKFHADPNIIGKLIDFDGQAYTVIGILPASFRFADKSADPQCLFASQLPSKIDWGVQMSLIRVIGRLAPGVSLSQARADLTTLAAQSNSEIPVAFVHMRDGLQVRVIPLHQKIVGDVRTALLVLLTAVLFVLLIACVNVANLQLVRTTGRYKELAVRAAIGASRARLIQQLLMEGAALAAIGGMVGLFLAAISVRFLRVSLPATITQIGFISIDRPVLLFALLITCLTAILFGLAPAFRASNPDVNDTLKDGGSRASGSYAHHRFRGALVAVEFTLAFLLLIGSGLLIRSFVRLSNVGPGFDPTNVLTVTTQLTSNYSTDAQRRAFFSQVLDRVRILPGVSSASLTTFQPLSHLGAVSPFSLEGQLELPFGTTPMVPIEEVGSDYFKTMRIPLVAGRSFTLSDLKPDSHAIIVSASFAQRFLPAGAPMSKRIQLGASGTTWNTIIGVVGDVHSAGLDHDAVPQIYLPYSGTRHAELATIVIRSEGDPRGMVSAVRAQFAAVDPLQPVFDINTMQQRLNDSIETPRINTTLLTIFASLALILATIGIYGVISYFVSQRTHEIGIRVALGAAPSDILRLVLGQGAVMILIGLALGMAGSLVLTRYLANLLYDVRPIDPVTIVSVAILLIVVALAACYIPARRALRLDPMIALRYE